MTTRTMKLTVAYEGTRYVGWQRQAHGTSIQGLLEAAFEPIVGTHVSVAGAGRTDAGVHAAGQVASVVIAHAIETGALCRALNARLPRDVRVLRAEEAHPAFHARFWATRKTYAYRVFHGQVVSPFDRAFVWHHPGPLDLRRVEEALPLLVGTHDFSAFQSAGSHVGTPVRTMFEARLDLVRTRERDVFPWCGEGTHVVIRLTADGFLRHMVRAIVGTLIEVGRGPRPVDYVADVLAGRDRRRAGQTAPANGLVLERIEHLREPPDRLLPRASDDKIVNRH